jgi:hypothetical protein
MLIPVFYTGCISSRLASSHANILWLKLNTMPVSVVALIDSVTLGLPKRPCFMSSMYSAVADYDDPADIPVRGSTFSLRIAYKVSPPPAGRFPPGPGLYKVYRE